MTSLIAWLVLGALALVGGGFAAFPLLRGRAGVATALAVGALVAAGGAAMYATLGRPDLAARNFVEPSSDDVPGLIASLSRAVRTQPNNLQAWIWLGQGYLALGDTRDAAKAYAVAIRLAKTQRNFDSGTMASLLADYGVARSQEAGAVTADAEAAFTNALAADPKNPEARFYLGIAAAQRGDAAGAQRAWEALLADTPADAPYRGELVDRLAALRARQTHDQPAPDVQAMVEGLAARLKSNPDDLDGWRRLIRSYAVLGNTPRARAALADARRQFTGRADALAALAASAHENKLE